MSIFQGYRHIDFGTEKLLLILADDTELGRGSAGRSVSLQRPGAQGKARTRCRMFESEQRNESSAQTLLAQSQFRILSLNFGLSKRPKLPPVDILGFG